MRTSMEAKIQRYQKQGNRRHLRKKIVQVLSCIVVFVTTYALVLPAITQEKNIYCSIEEHTHTQQCFEKQMFSEEAQLSCSYETLGVHVHTPDCYDSEKNLVCGLADYVVHEHTAICREGEKTCVLPEVKLHTHTQEECYVPQYQQVHNHTDACITREKGALQCDLTEGDGHTHDPDGCYSLSQTPVCGLEETQGHTHGALCSEKKLVCQLTVEPHIHGEGCYTQLNCDIADESHTHNDECSGKKLSCELTEQTHNHTDGCYETTLTCTLDEVAAHSHSRTCYNPQLKCDQKEQSAHVHTDDCYAWTETFVCGFEEGQGIGEPEYILECEKPEVKLHTHGDACYETYTDDEGNEQKRLICKELALAEHIHSDSCYTTVQIPAEDVDTLTCTLEVTEGHTHGDGCYADAKTLTCTLAESQDHSHGDSCYQTGRNLTCTQQESPGHTHGDLCYGTWKQVCQLEEHTHDEQCTPILVLPEGERARVEAVIALIDALPTYDEISEKLDEYYEAEDTDGELAYTTEVYAQVDEAYKAYQELGEELQQYVTNRDKLMELDFIWSRTVIPAETYNYSPIPGAAENTRIYLFDYGSLINTKITGEGMGLLPFYRIFPEYGYTVDGEEAWDHDNPNSSRYGQLDTRPPVINNRLADGYPYIENGNQGRNGSWLTQWGSLRYLFDPDYIAGNYWSKDYWVTEVRRNTSFTNPYTADAVNPTGNAAHFRRAYLPVKNNGNGTGLFLRDSDGYWYYDSGRNAAWYNPATEHFELYNYTVIPGHEAFDNYGGTTNGNFLPFNKGHVEGLTDYQTSEKKVHASGKDPNLVSGAVLWNNRVTASVGDVVDGYPLLRENFRLITSDRSNSVNLNFGMVVEFDFYMPKDGMIDGSPMEFIFKGDDDVWVFIDDVLVLDIGGCHGAESASINFATGALTQPGSAAGYHKPTSLKNAFNNAGVTTGFTGNTFSNYTYHTLKFFYMERGGNISFCRLKFNIPQLKQNTLSVAKELTSTSTVDMVGNPDFSFQVMKADSNGNPTTTPFFGAGVKYSIYDSNTNELIGEGTTGEYGVFTLKAGQRAEFTGISEDSGKYYVRELIDIRFYSQYSKIYVNGVEAQRVETVWGKYKAPSSPVRDFSDGTTLFTFVNHVDASKLSYLTITKMVEGLSASAARDIGYDMEVLLNGSPIPVGTPYQLYDTVPFVQSGSKVPVGETQYVTTAGIVTVLGGTTAEIDNILPGTTFHVSETDGSAHGYSVSYGEFWGTDWIQVDADGKGVGGTVPVYDTSNLSQAHVCVTVTNKLTSVHVPFSVYKQIPNGNLGSAQVSFTANCISAKANYGNGVDVSSSLGEASQQTVDITVNTTGWTEAAFHFNFTQSQFPSNTTWPVKLTYEITENVPSAGEYSHDGSKYYATFYLYPQNGKFLYSNLALTDTNGKDRTESGVGFTNYLLGNLTLEKTVEGGSVAQENGSFRFTLQLGESATKALANWPVRVVKNGQLQGTVTTAADGTIILEGVKHGDKLELQGIPLGAAWKITEANVTGYLVSWTANGTAGSGTVSTGSMPAGGMTVVYTNTSTYFLPETGGGGTVSYTMAGLALICIGVVYLMYSQALRRRKDVSSP